MKKILKSLDKKLKKLKTDCMFRNAEIDNLRTIILALEFQYDLILKRINELEIKKDFAGKHECQKLFNKQNL